MIILLFISAFSLSSIAAYYAIMGLMAIFSGAPYSIAIMGAALELSKIVIASWIYRNWNEVSWLLKTYFVSAIIVLMTLTSMGIFGYLSKAHSDQGMIVGDVQFKLNIIDEKINFQKEIINDARKTIAQLDRQVDETLNRTATQENNAGVNRSVTIRRQQAKERAQLAKSISSAQEEIAKLTAEKAPLAKEARVVEAEVGPIKYIAALIYDDNPDANVLEKAVRIMILMIVGVFDPLAVLMFIALNDTLARREKNKVEEKIVEAPVVVDPPKEEPKPVVEEPLVEPVVEEIKEPNVEESVKPEKILKEYDQKNSIGRHMKISEQLLAEDTIKIEKI